MVGWVLDKKSKVPLYLQLKDLLRYYISTGAIRENEQLPGVMELAARLGINFETVRKAYHELEGAGFLVIRRGRGTFASLLKNQSREGEGAEGADLDAHLVAEQAVKEVLKKGKNLDEARKIFDAAFAEIDAASRTKAVIFTECNASQLRVVSKLLKSHLKMEVRPVLLSDLPEAVRKARQSRDVLSIITCGFHIQEVKDTVGDAAIDIQALITNVSPATRRELQALPETTHFGFICSEKEALCLIRDLVVRTELGPKARLSCASLKEPEKVRRILDEVDVLLATPGAGEKVRRSAPARLRIFDIGDHIDPLSLSIVKDRVLALL